METKPIFVVKLPDIMSHKDIIHLKCNLDKELSDYHILVVPSNVDEPKFEAFYEKDFNEVKFEELKQIVKDNFKS